jgi:predicted NBD/HSP70 family sugar kinase
VANFIFLHVGTGVGAGLVLNGELFRGASGAAGEIGYVPVAAGHIRTSSSRRRGALESAAGAAAVREEARRKGVKPPLTPERIFAAARRGDPAAEQVVRIEAERIAVAIATVVPVVDPELVVLGGGIGRNGDLLLEPVERELRVIMPFHPRIEVSSLGEEAELRGAVATALRAAQERLFRRGDAGGVAM